MLSARLEGGAGEGGRNEAGSDPSSRNHHGVSDTAAKPSERAANAAIIFCLCGFVKKEGLILCKIFVLRCFSPT